MTSLKNYLSAVPGSIRGLIDSRELNRSILTALGSGSALGVVILVLQSIQSHATEVFPDPGTAGLATMFLTLVLDLLRRQNQGGPATPASIARTLGVPSGPSPYSHEIRIDHGPTAVDEA